MKSTNYTSYLSLISVFFTLLFLNVYTTEAQRMGRGGGGGGGGADNNRGNENGGIRAAVFV